MHQKETVTISRDDLKVENYDKLGGNGRLVEDTLYLPRLRCPSTTEPIQLGHIISILSEPCDSLMIALISLKTKSTAQC